MFKLYKTRMKNGGKYNPDRLSLEYYDYEFDEQPDKQLDKQPDELPDEKRDTTDMSYLGSEESAAQRNTSTISKSIKMLTPNQILNQLPIVLAQVQA